MRLLAMLLTGGRERTQADYRELFANATGRAVGLKLSRVIPTAHQAVEIIEAVAAETSLA